MYQILRDVKYKHKECTEWPSKCSFLKTGDLCVVTFSDDLTCAMFDYIYGIYFFVCYMFVTFFKLKSCLDFVLITKQPKFMILLPTQWLSSALV